MVAFLASASVLWQDAGCGPGPHFPTQVVVDLGPSDRNMASYVEYNRCVARTTGGPGEHEHWQVWDGQNLGRRMDLGGVYEATVVDGDGWVIDRSTRVRYVNTANERSIAVWVSGPGGFDFLVTEELIGRRFGSENALFEPELGAALAARGVDLEVLRVGHNGADNTSSSDFIEALRPEAGLLSVSAQNEYGHPGCNTVDTLNQLDAQTQAGNSPCGAIEDALVADGHLAVWVQGSQYQVQSTGNNLPGHRSPDPTLSLLMQCGWRMWCPAVEPFDGGDLGTPGDVNPSCSP